MLAVLKCCLHFWFDCKWIHFLIVCVGFLCVTCQTQTDVDHKGFIRMSDRNITAFSNRNLTIICYATIHNRSDASLFFTPNARMVLTFMPIPREMKPLHQMQSFLHCNDPARTDCLAEFNLDVSCIEDQMKPSYVYKRNSYRIEAACQVDDSKVCSYSWVVQHPVDCYDVGKVTVVRAPKLNEKCLYLPENRTLDCGYHQECDAKYGICLCEKNFIASNKQCIASPYEQLPVTVKASTYSADSTYNTDSDDKQQNGSNVNIAGNQDTFKAIVIFLLVVAILLCIALGIVIIWSRHYRRLIEEVSTS